jgi:hypothetical protein
MRSQTYLIVATALLVAGLTSPVWAHHAFNSEFDAAKPIKLEGVVKKVEWINPHSWITIDVKGADGKVETWEIEAGAPNAMFRRGFTRNSLPVGTQIVVNGYRAKDGRTRANGRDLTLPDGKRLFMGSSGTGAPQDGADPTQK